MASLMTASLAEAAPVAQAGVAEAQLRALNHAHVQAFIASDQAFFESVVAKDFRFTGSDGAWLDRAQFMALAKDAPRVDSISYDDVQVRLLGDVGLVHGTVAHVKKDGAVGKTRYTDAYRWDGSAWRLVSAQLSPVGEPAQSTLVSEAAPAHPAWPGSDPLGDDLAVLRVLNEGYVSAFLNSDVAWYDAHLTPDYRVVFPDGSFYDKGSLLAAAAHPVTSFKSFPVTEVDIRLFGDVALIHAENPYEGKDGRKGVNRYTDIWQKRDGRWVCVAAHVTRHKLPA